jgi:hypothetical protein
MIFNEMNTSKGSYGAAVQESQYDLGIGGALMHVYENECNYNALMKAVALSEMKYYNATGGDLFVQEAGAFKGFIEKAKAFFHKVIEKIKSIGKKFVAKINQYTMSDKDFVKKYQKDLLSRDLKDFEFDGYAFPNISSNKYNLSVEKAYDGISEDGSDDSDRLNEIIEENRGRIVGGSAMTESEFRTELHDKLYGDKDSIKVNIRSEIGIISETSKLIKESNKAEKDAVDGINKFIKLLDQSATRISKDISLKASDEENKTNSNLVRYENNTITVAKSLSNDFTVFYGALVKALADRNRQAKAICVKALSYKHESASVAEGGYADLFDGVQII